MRLALKHRASGTHRSEYTKANNLNIYKYLTYILEQRPDNNWSDEQLETIAPWNKAVIDVCKNN